MFHGLSLAVILTTLLAACDHAPIAQRAAAPSTQGAVNPDAGVTSYKCADGSLVVAGYPDSKTAVVTYKNHAYTLKLAPSASGARYTGYGLQWWTKGAQAQVAVLKPGEEAATTPGMDCAAQSQPATATRTAFRPSSP